MAAGFKYNLEPEVEQEERYDVETGRRRRGPYKLDTTNLVVGSYFPSFTPIAADLVKKHPKWLSVWKYMRSLRQAPIPH